MKQPLQIFILLLLCSTALSAQDIRSRWVNTPIVMDGSPSDWPQPFTFYNSATKLEYAIANDTGSIYICIKVSDEQTGMRIFRGGMNLWLDTKGKKKETSGIGFPLKASLTGAEEPKSPEDKKQQREPYRKHDFNEIKGRITLHQLNMKVMGLLGIEDDIIPLKNAYGVTAAFGWDSLNVLCIEYKLPVSTVLGHRLSAKDTLNALGLGLVEIALEGNMRNKPDSESTGWDNGTPQNMNNNNGMGGPNNNMQPGMNMGRGSGNLDPAAFSTYGQEEKLWTRFLLAYMH